MITQEEAIAIVADHWNKSVEKDGDEFHLSSVNLTEEQDFWVIRGNTKASIVDGDLMRMAIGISGFIVDSENGALEAAGSAQKPEDIAQDCRDDKKAGELHYF